MAKAELSETNADRRPGLTAVLFLVACVGSVLLLDALFRLYEHHFLIHVLDSRGPHYDIESLGYNDHVGSIASGRTEDEFRILSFGDSYAKSITTAEYSYAAVAERVLQAAVPERRIRIVNFGREITSFPDYLSQFRIWSSKLEFDAVLFNIYAGNDFHDVRGAVFLPQERDFYLADPDAEELRYGPGVNIPHRYPLRFIDYLWAQLASRQYAAKPTSKYRRSIQMPLKTYAETNVPHVDVYRLAGFSQFVDAQFWIEKLAEQARDVEKTGALVALTVAPPHFLVSPVWREPVLKRAGATLEELEAELPASAIRSAADRAGLSGPVLDWTACLIAEGAKGPELYWGTNMHWNVRGNELVGRMLGAELAQRWFQRTVPDEWKPPPDCETDAAAPSAEFAELLDSMLGGVRDLERFETKVLVDLRERSFRSIPELRQALVDLGYRQDPAIRGAFWGFLGGAHGWAIDTTALGEQVDVLLFHEGRMVSAVRTREASPDVAGKVGLAGADDVPLLYRTQTRETLRLTRGTLWVVAISPTGRFGFLVVEQIDRRQPAGRGARAPMER